LLRPTSDAAVPSDAARQEAAAAAAAAQELADSKRAAAEAAHEQAVAEAEVQAAMLPAELHEAAEAGDADRVLALLKQVRPTRIPIFHSFTPVPLLPRSGFPVCVFCDQHASLSPHSASVPLPYPALAGRLLLATLNGKRTGPINLGSRVQGRPMAL
jgi:hypothetical protein